MTAQNFQRLYGNLKISNDLIQFTEILNNAGIDELLDKLSNGRLKNTQVCKIIKGRCIVHSYITQSTSNDSLNLHEVSKGLMRSKLITIACLPELGENGWVIPQLNRRHFHLKKEYLVNKNETIHQSQLQNTTYMSSILRDLNPSETTLSHFLIYSKENLGA